MTLRPALIIAIIIAGCAAVYAAPARAGSFEVAPTTMTLAPGSHSAALFITNRGSVPAVAQIEAFDWTQDNGNDKLEPSNTLMVSPPMTRLLPGQKQTIRLAVGPGGQTDKELAYRLIISELPDASVDKEQGVQVLLQFSVPIFVVATPRKNAEVVWSAERTPAGWELVARNMGARHLKISDLMLNVPGQGDVAVDASHFHYILADSAHAWKLDASAIRPGQEYTLKAKDENAGALSAGIFIPQ